MAATNFTPIQLYRTTTAAAIPTAGNLAAGELGINLTDERLYFKNAAGVVKLLASNSGALGTVTSVDVSGGTTGLTTSGGPITSSGTITLAGTLGVANGGTGATTFTANGVVYGNTTSALLVTAAGTTGQVLVGNTGGAPSWATLTSIGVTSFSAGTTGFTPSTATTGAITLAGTLGVANGGTGTATAFTAGSVVFAGASGVYSQDNANFFWDDTNNQLGIGTATPVSRLNVSGTTGFTWPDGGGTSSGLVTIGTQGTGGSLFVNTASLSAGFASGLAIDGTYSSLSSVVNIKAVGVKSGGGYNASLAFHTSSETTLAERMRITGAGDVGIGTSSPGEKLQVVGSIRVNTTGTIFSNIYTSPGNTQTWLVNNGSSSDTYLTSDTAQRYRMLTGVGHRWETAASGTAGAAISWTERMVLDTSGNVGIGTSSITPILGRTLQIGDGTTNSSISLIGSGASTTGDGYIASTAVAFEVYSRVSTPMIFGTNDTERMRIDASGNVGIGTSTAYGGRLNIVPATNPTTASGANQISIGESGSNTAYRLNVGYMLVSGSYYAGSIQSIAGSAGAPLILNGDGGGVGIGTYAPTNCRLQIKGANNTTGAFADGLKVTSNNETVEMQYSWWGINGGAIHFGISGTEKARIDSSGNLLVGCTSTAFAGGANTGIYLTNTSGGTGGLHIKNTANNTGTKVVTFYGWNDTETGSIETYVNVTNYNISSDARLKENIADADDTASLIDAIKVRKFDWKSNGSHQRYGMVAQELVEVAPEAVSQQADPEEMMGVDYSKLVPMLVKEIQSLRARVAQLEGN